MANSRDLTIATFNLYNLHLPGEPIYSDANGWSREEYEAKRRWIGFMLRELDADLIGFQECWSSEALRDCFREAGLLDSYDIVARDTQPAGIQVALAVRKGMLAGDPVWIESFPDDVRFLGLREARDAQEKVDITISKFSRPPLAVRIQPKGTGPKPPEVNVRVMHLKSKGPTTLDFRFPQADVLQDHAQIAKQVVSHVRRVVEAGAMRAMLDKEMKGNAEPFVVLGDLNDGSLAVTTELLSGEPGYRFFEKSRAGSKSDAGLYSVERLQQLRSLRHVYYTYEYKEKMESLDHILVSDAFYDHSIARKWSFREMAVFNDHLALPDSHRKALGASDHGVVRARFDWNPMAEVLSA